jgi:hypothetical protein
MKPQILGQKITCKPTTYFDIMAYKSKSKKKSIANARKVKVQKWGNTNLDALESDSDVDSVKEVTAWSGGVNNHLVVSESDSDFDDMEWDSDSSEEEVDELEGDELVDSLQREIEHEICLLQVIILRDTPNKELWLFPSSSPSKSDSSLVVLFDSCSNRSTSPQEKVGS